MSNNGFLQPWDRSGEVEKFIFSKKRLITSMIYRVDTKQM